ncbi:MxaK protein [Methylomonas paludis]|uniref:MxaK protein n=1 Tax=Methylomonas paludis TaxID=1173101 RepID=A0A975R896_9GAMM|nr:MxaK protein [Methylomonas paludis]QWF70145.1 MxaK protein [Methylomonas paludis]
MMRAVKHQLIWLVLLSSIGFAVGECWKIYQLQRQNLCLATLAAGHDIALEQLQGSAPELRLARAIYLHQHQRFQEALATLSLIVGQGDQHFQAMSRYNLGNVYLSAAQAEIAGAHINQALPLLSLAKQAYRQALRLDSGFWDAKYNLEVALRLLPEFDRISNDQPDSQQTPPTQLWTTLPGFPRGLP